MKIPWVRRDLSGARILVMEWIDGLRCTNPRGIQSSGIDVDEFIRCGVVSGLRQLLEVCLAPAAIAILSPSSTPAMVDMVKCWGYSLMGNSAFCFGTWAVRRLT